MSFHYCCESTKFKRQLQCSIALCLALGFVYSSNLYKMFWELALHHLSFARARAVLFRKLRPVLWSDQNIFNAGVLRTTESERLKTHFCIKVKTLAVQSKNMSSGEQYNQLDYMSNVWCNLCVFRWAPPSRTAGVWCVDGSDWVKRKMKDSKNP